MTHAHDDSLGEFAQELRALAETLLERIEPALRRAAADGREWDSCSWCPLCAAAALVRGEHHEVVAAVADHGTAIVTVLREALAGVPVEPLLPDDLPEFDEPSSESDSTATEFGADPSSFRTEYDGWIAGGPSAESQAADDSDRGGGDLRGAAAAERGGGGVPGAQRAREQQPGETRRGGRRAAKRAGRGQDPAERPGYVPIQVRIKK